MLEFLFDATINLTDLNISKVEADVFENDPTVSLTANWGSAFLDVSGHTHTDDSIFNVKLIFESNTIEFQDWGTKITLYSNENKSVPVFQQSDCLKNYMQNVVTQIIKSTTSDGNTNFTSTLNLNKKLLKYINKKI